MNSSSWFGCLWSQIIHVVEKLRQGFVESGGEYFGIIAFEIYLLKCSFFCCHRILEVQIIIFK